MRAGHFAGFSLLLVGFSSSTLTPACALSQ
jgi:hypothetical protein